MASRAKQIGAVVAALLVVGVAYRLSSKSESVPSATPSASSEPTTAGLAAPIAASYTEGGEVVVAALDLTAKGIRVQRIDAKDAIVGERIVVTDVAASADSELSVAASGEGVAVTWRGLRGGKLVRQFFLLGRDLAPKGEPADVVASSCATRDGVWFADGSHATSRSWSGATTKIDLPKDKEASLLCGAHRAYAVLDDEEHTAIQALAKDAKAIAMLREKDFGEDEQRALSEYTVGEDIGVVRLAVSGAVTVREISGGTLGRQHTLKTTIPKDDDLVAVDASARTLAIVYTQDVSSACTGEGQASTKVTVLRVDRQSFEESTEELSPGRCGHEVGPFYTGVVGDAVSVAWAERAGGIGRPRAPIVGLAHATVGPTDKPKSERIEAAAEALVDAMCDGTSCYAASLVRREDKNVVRVLRYK